MKKGFFKNDKIKAKTDSDCTMNTTDLKIQILADSDITETRYMPAGADEDQSLRLKNMSKVVKEYSPVPLITTEQCELSNKWLKLFKAIDEADWQNAQTSFKEIPASDRLLKVLKGVHTEEYLLEIIQNCILAHKTGIKRLNSDIVITPKTFEILMKDCALTLMSTTKATFSFGLPSHHAFSETGTGFCVLNKTALLIKHAELTSSKPLQYMVVGTDVNRDNGLCDVLRRQFSHLPICHIDVFDSRVYPGQNAEDINLEFSTKGTTTQQKIQKWSSDKYDYFMVDLKDTYRKKVGVHPALLFALEQIKEKVKLAKSKGIQIALLMPTGWDSHEDETAPCGKFVDGRMMGYESAKTYRFNDGDLSYFYEEVFKLYNDNPDCFASLYWGLEGGYDNTMYTKQIKLLMQLISKELVPKATHSTPLNQL
ncbi:acetylpolyamine aminohydrolase [Legionella waltersii]|uniref:Acetylpolyamine aminohydrolase n=1 Tax=Legionella waltersii TaxID=66969 RepID=A0A0W1A0K6_9GAMM|nr:acetylpolyamine aminohydrolase [Legionella waltersii]KTD74656.1 acetylpolyamine aminohydrolase [Legionella waltersii]SNV09064.1 acetylpolyamine aminohydolase [Legionella waltersii]